MKKYIIILVLFTFFFTGCEFGTRRITNKTDNQQIVLNKGEKLIDVDWRYLELDYNIKVDVWYLTRPMTEKDSAVTYKYSNGEGGIITITEQK